MCQLASIRADRERDRPDARAGRHDDGAAAVVDGAARRARGPPFEPAKRSPIHARHRELGARMRVGGRLAPRLRLRRPRGRGASGARGGRPDRRLDARQAARARAGRRRVPRPPVPEPDLQPEARAGALRRAHARTPAGSWTTGRSAGSTSESFYVTTTSSGAGAVEQWFSWWLADWGLDVHLTDVTQALVRGQPRRPARARDPRRRLTELDCSPRGVRLPRRAPGAGRGRAVRCCCGSASSASSATRSTSRRRTASTCGTRCSRRAPAPASARSASSRSGSCACRSSTSSSARTPTRSRRRTARRCRGRSSSTRTRSSSAGGRSRTRPSIAAADGAGRLHGRRRPGADARARSCSTARRAAGQVTSARRSRQLGRVIGMAWVPARARRGRRAHHDLRRGQRRCEPRS